MTEEKKIQGSRFRIPILVAFFGMSAMFLMAGARASTISDLPTQLGASLGISAENAGLLLSCGILVSIGLICAMAGRKMNLIATAVPMIAAMAFLVAIAWLPFWILIVIALIVAFMFAPALRSILTGA